MGAAERRLADAAERAEADQAALQKCAAEAGALGEAAEAAAACSAVRRELAAEAGKLRAALEERSAALDAALAAEAKATAAAGVTAEQAWLQTSNLGATSAQPRRNSRRAGAGDRAEEGSVRRGAPGRRGKNCTAKGQRPNQAAHASTTLFANRRSPRRCAWTQMRRRARPPLRAPRWPTPLEAEHRLLSSD